MDAANGYADPAVKRVRGLYLKAADPAAQSDLYEVVSDVSLKRRTRYPGHQHREQPRRGEGVRRRERQDPGMWVTGCQWDIVNEVTCHEDAAGLLRERPDCSIGRALTQALNVDAALCGMAKLSSVTNEAGRAILIDDQVHARQCS